MANNLTEKQRQIGMLVTGVVAVLAVAGFMIDPVIGLGVIAAYLVLAIMAKMSKMPA